MWRSHRGDSVIQSLADRMHSSLVLVILLSKSTFAALAIVGEVQGIFMGHGAMLAYM
jgi:hypothetical protein